MPNWIHGLWSAAHILVPILLAVLLVIRIIQVRLRDGVRPLELPFDRKFLTAFFYTGALLAIYLSCVHFYTVALKRPGG